VAKKRDYKAEYRRRIARGLTQGLTKAQARGHAEPNPPRKQAKPKNAAVPKADKKLNAAILEMNRGRSLTAAARLAHVSAERLRTFLQAHKVGKRKGRRWVPRDNRPRRVLVTTKGTMRVVFVAGYEPARLVGEHHHAASAFVRTNDPELLKPFKGKSIRSMDGKSHPLETDPNALHRIAAMDTPPFHEIYEITSN
jgi:hypothetical protein